MRLQMLQSLNELGKLRLVVRQRGKLTHPGTIVEVQLDQLNQHGLSRGMQSLVHKLLDPR